jgi:hypothetical protein
VNPFPLPLLAVGRLKISGRGSTLAYRRSDDRLLLLFAPYSTASRLTKCSDQGPGVVSNRAPRRQPTVGQLMLHTAGFGYEFFSHYDLRYRQSRGIPSIIECTFESVQWVLFSDPGGRWNYGVNIDLGGHPPGSSQYPWSRGAPGGLAPSCRHKPGLRSPTAPAPLPGSAHPRILITSRS